MKKLITVNKKMFILLFLLLISLIIVLYLFFTTKIEKTINAQLQCVDFSRQELITNSNCAYFIKTGEKVTFKIQNDYHYATIKDAWIKDDKLHITLKDLDMNLINNTTISAEIIYEQETILESIFS